MVEKQPDEGNAVPEKVEASEELCKMIWSEPDSEGHRHFVGLECDSAEARDRVAGDMENKELIVRVRSIST